MIIYKLGKHIKSAIVGIFRNFWMSFSAATAVAITLLLVSLFTVLSTNVEEFMNTIEKNITIRVMVDNSYDEKNIYDEKTGSDVLGDKIKQISGVAEAKFTHKDEEFDKYTSLNEESQDIYEKFKKNNPMKHVYRVTLEEGNNDYERISTEIKNLDGVYAADYGTGGIHRLVQLFQQVSNVMIIFMVALVLLAIFLISNTIKMTIYSRKTEIQIMRLVGASNGYIRFPFVLEGIFVGLIGAILPAGITVLVYSKLVETYSSGFVSASLQLVGMETIYLIALGLFGLGALVGMIGSMISIGRYLKA